jgi:hypothetical protein
VRQKNERTGPPPILVTGSGVPAVSGAESFSSVTEQHVKRRLIQAQSAAIARAMASICNDEQGSFGVMSGHDRNSLSLSGRCGCQPN